MRPACPSRTHRGRVDAIARRPTHPSARNGVTPNRRCARSTPWPVPRRHPIYSAPAGPVSKHLTPLASRENTSTSSTDALRLDSEEAVGGASCGVDAR